MCRIESSTIIANYCRSITVLIVISIMYNYPVLAPYYPVWMILYPLFWSRAVFHVAECGSRRSLSCGFSGSSPGPRTLDQPAGFTVYRPTDRGDGAFFLERAQAPVRWPPPHRYFFLLYRQEGGIGEIAEMNRTGDFTQPCSTGR